MQGAPRGARTALALLATSSLLVAPPALDAQSVADSVAGASTRFVEAPALGSDLEDRQRLAQILGRDSVAGFMARSLSSRLRLPRTEGEVRWTFLTPELLVVNNSTLPFSRNDGAMWAGRGTTLRLSGGAATRRGRFHVVIAPEIVWGENREFQEVDRSRFHRPFIDWGKVSSWASPWHQHPFPADLPVRFGERHFVVAGPGQSAAWGEWGSLAAGLSAENLWWGPGIHDALIMTNNAAGVPQLFLRTARPLRTPVGEFEGRWLVGTLSESRFYDYVPENDYRSLSAAVVTWRPRWEPDLTVGVARAVFASADGFSDSFGRWFDVIQPGHRPNARPWSDSTYTGGRDGLTSVFARWVFPSQGAEVYGEVGRAERPASLRDFLVNPSHTRGYVLGGQVARPFGLIDGHWRLQAEFTQLEQSPTYRFRPTHSWYSSRATPQGYTQSGQVIGSGIGPGSSHQWVAADLIAPSWSVGAFVGRWRQNDDAWFLVQFPLGTGWCEYDTTLYPGFRGSVRARGVGVLRAELSLGNRLNAWNQNNSGCPLNTSVVDVRNRTLKVSLVPLVF